MKYMEFALQQGGRLVCLLRDGLAQVPATAVRPGVLVIPGGGYEHIGTREGEPVAMQFLAAGYHAFLLADYGIRENARHYTPLRQVSEALGLIRAHAAEWGVAADRLAVCGFSAGGHLALSSAVLTLPEQEQAAAQQRPNAVILGYPVISSGAYAHRGSFAMLAGSDDPAAQEAFRLEDKLRPGMPPVFVWHTVTDETVPVENTLLLIAALKKSGISFEAHLFPHGPHGTSLCTAEVGHELPHNGRWMELAVEWLGEVFRTSTPNAEHRS